MNQSIACGSSDIIGSISFRNKEGPSTARYGNPHPLQQWSPAILRPSPCHHGWQALSVTATAVINDELWSSPLQTMFQVPVRASFGVAAQRQFWSLSYHLIEELWVDFQWGFDAFQVTGRASFNSFHLKCRSTIWLAGWKRYIYLVCLVQLEQGSTTSTDDETMSSAIDLGN